MSLSVFDLFKIGIGPSSSHTVGPMRAAGLFLDRLAQGGWVERVARVETVLYGSLALTGKGHATDKAVILGLLGEEPDRVDPDGADALVERVRLDKCLLLGRARGWDRPLPFHEEEDLRFEGRQSLPGHPNALRLTARDACGDLLDQAVFYSVGGGFVVADPDNLPIGRVNGSQGHLRLFEGERSDSAAVPIPFDFSSARRLLEIGREHHLSIAQIMWANETARRPAEEVRAGLDRIWETMTRCIERGCRQEGILPGGLGVRRRAAILRRQLEQRTAEAERLNQPLDPLTVLDWVNLFALAVNEENAAGGRVVTAPTNGAAGVIPAVIAYYERFIPNANRAGIHDFLLTAAAIGALYKKNASLSAAEMGCQGEVGVACSMAAAGLAAVLGGDNNQIENAAEIGMEHHLGMTCDPIGGLVQIPCIERNTMGAAKAINAARLALSGDGVHYVPLDKVIATMKQTGLDMQAKYKETSLGGLAVNLVEC